MAKTLFKGATIIDGNGAAPFVGNLLVEGKSILEVGANTTCDDAKIVDLSGKYIMPGMINAHAHIVLDGELADPFGQLEKETDATAALRATRTLKRALKSGVTFFRDMGCRNYIDIDLRNARNQGLIEGPEFIVAGKVVTMTGGHIWKIGREADGPNEVRKAAREQLKAGVDFIKIVATGGVLTMGSIPGAPQLSVEEMSAAVEEAKKVGKKTAAHCIGMEGIHNAVKAGIDSIEHGFYLNDEIIELMIKKGTYLVPTINAIHAIRKGGVEAGIPKDACDKNQKNIAPSRESFLMAYKAGVKVAMGPDSGTPLNGHMACGEEVRLFVEYGVKPMEAIIFATKNAADLLGISGRYGTLENGKAADFLVLGANPIEDIEALQNKLECVYKLGELVE